MPFSCTDTSQTTSLVREGEKVLKNILLDKLQKNNPGEDQGTGYIGRSSYINDHCL